MKFNKCYNVYEGEAIELDWAWGLAVVTLRDHCIQGTETYMQRMTRQSDIYALIEL